MAKNEMIIEVGYAYYLSLNKLPKIKYKKFTDKAKAKEFIDGIKSAKKKFLWNILYNGIEVEHL